MLGVSWPTDNEGIRMPGPAVYVWACDGLTSPAVFLRDNATLVYAAAAQLKVNHSEYLVFRQIDAFARDFCNVEQRCQRFDGARIPADTKVVVGQVWMASDGSLGLVATIRNVTTSFVAKVRIDGHTHSSQEERSWLTETRLLLVSRIWTCTTAH